MIDCICEVIREKQIYILDFWNLAFNYSLKTLTLGYKKWTTLSRPYHNKI